MPKIVDTFIFYNELDMLEFRLKEMGSCVDYIVIVEATKTFAGKDKPLYFMENKHRYEKYQHKIVHVIADDMPMDCDAWGREWYQRNSIAVGVNSLGLDSNDIIIISDCDEIMDSNMLTVFKENGISENIRPVLELYYYNFTCKAQNHHSIAAIVRYDNFNNKTCEEHSKDRFGYKEYHPAGWHLSYFGDAEFISNKIQQFSHQEFNNIKNTSPIQIMKKIKGCADLFGRKGQGGPHKFMYFPLEKNKYLPMNYKMLLHEEE